jgi:hypothetical protein
MGEGQEFNLPSESFFIGGTPDERFHGQACHCDGMSEERTRAGHFRMVPGCVWGVSYKVRGRSRLRRPMYAERI